MLDRITETTRAASAYVFPDEDIEVKVSSFFSKINEPVLTNVKLRFPDSVRVSKLHPPTMPDLFKGEQLVLAGRCSGSGRGRITLEGSAEGSPKSFEFDALFPESAADMEFVPQFETNQQVRAVAREAYQAIGRTQPAVLPLLLRAMSRARKPQARLIMRCRPELPRRASP